MGGFEIHGLKAVRIACGVGVALLWAASAHASVTVKILPESLTVAPGDTINITINAVAGDSAFNAFGAFVAFDSTLLSPIPISPLSNQVGSGMKAACGSQFNDFRAGLTRDTINCSLLCGGASVSAPAELYKLRFRVGLHAHSDTIGFAKLQLFNGGRATPNTHFSAYLRVPVSAVGEPLRSPTAALRAWPNPSRGGVLFSLEGARAPAATLTVLDLQGRAIRHLQASAGRVWWDGRSESGARLPPGVYPVIARSGGTVTRTRVAVLH